MRSVQVRLSIYVCVCVCLHEYVGACVQRRKTEERERGNR